MGLDTLSRQRLWPVVNTAPAGHAGMDYDRERERRARWRMSIGLLMASLVLYHLSAIVQFALADQFFDFAHYYLYARNLVDGHNFSDIEATQRLAHEIGLQQYANFRKVVPVNQIGRAHV